MKVTKQRIEAERIVLLLLLIAVAEPIATFVEMLA